MIERNNQLCLCTDSAHRRELTAWSPRLQAWFPQPTARWGGAGEPKLLGGSKKLNKMRPKLETSEKRPKGSAKTFKFDHAGASHPLSRSDL